MAEMRHFALAKECLEQWLQARPALCYLTLPLHQWEAGISLWRRWCHVGAGSRLAHPADGLPPAAPLGCSSTGFVSSVSSHTSSSLTDAPATSHLLPILSPFCLVPWAEQSCSFLTSGLLWVSVSRSESPFAALCQGLTPLTTSLWGPKGIPH